MANLRDILLTLERFGFSEIVLPFILVFVLVYALMMRTKVFTNKNYAAIVALVSAFFFISFTVLVGRMMIFIPYFVLILIFMFMMQIVFGATGNKVKKNKFIRIIFIVIMGFLFLIFFGLNPIEAFQSIVLIITKPWVLMLLFVIGIFYYMTRSGSSNSDTDDNKANNKEEIKENKIKKEEKAKEIKQDRKYDNIEGFRESKHKPSFNNPDGYEHVISIDNEKDENFLYR